MPHKVETGASALRGEMSESLGDAPAARVERHDGWGELVLSRPRRRNALTGPLVAGLRAGLADLLAGGARVVLLRGEGGAFCSGLDLAEFGANPAPEWRESFPESWAALHRELYDCKAVIVGALERFAINGGASLALACDLLVAGEGAWLQVGEAALGMAAPMNIAWLRLRTSEAIAAQLCLGADRVAAPDLRRLGLAYRVVADAAVLAEAQTLAARLAGFPNPGLAGIKAALRRAVGGGAGVFAVQANPAGVDPA